MSNATVSSQVFVVRNAGALSAVSSGTMVLYADGTDVYAKDSAGNTYNLSHPSASALSIAANDLTDVTIASLSNNDVFKYNSSTAQWENVTIATLAGSIAISDLSNVDAAAPSDGEVLAYVASSGNWEPASASATVAALNNIGDVSVPTPSGGDVLIYNNSSSQWEAGTTLSGFTISDGSTSIAITSSDTITFASSGTIDPVIGAGPIIDFDLNAAIHQLNNVNAGSPSDGDILKYDLGTTNWVNGTLSIDDLSDVDTSIAPTTNQVLVWDSSNWVAGNAAPVNSATTFHLVSPSYAPYKTTAGSPVTTPAAVTSSSLTVTSQFKMLKAHSVGRVLPIQLLDPNAAGDDILPLSTWSLGSSSLLNFIGGSGSATDVHGTTYTTLVNLEDFIDEGSTTFTSSEVWIDSSVTTNEKIIFQATWDIDYIRGLGISSNTAPVSKATSGGNTHSIFFEIIFEGGSAAMPSGSLTIDLDIQMGVTGVSVNDGSTVSGTNNYQTEINLTGVELFGSWPFTTTYSGMSITVSQTQYSTSNDTLQIEIQLTDAQVQLFLDDIINSRVESPAGTYNYGGYPHLAMALHNPSGNIGASTAGTGIRFGDLMFVSTLIGNF